MKIGLIGYGKMGKMVEEAALLRTHTIVHKFTAHHPMTVDALHECDVCIDFSHPEAALTNLETVAAANVNVVMGTTGWYHDLKKAEEIVLQHNIGMLYSPNFSVGVALFLQIVEQASHLINDFEAYDVGIIETHHNQKVDSPSGTAKLIASHIEKKMDRKKNVEIASLRCGAVPGEHHVIFDSAIDQITITHKALNRQGFAQGAVVGAEWLKEKKGVFTLDHLIGKK